MKVFTAPQAAWSTPGALDVSPGAAGAWRVKAPEGLPEGLWPRFLRGAVSEREAMLLGLLVTAETVATLRGPAAAMVENLAAADEDVTLTCDCARHGEGHCLRLAVASGLAVALGEGAAYGGERGEGAPRVPGTPRPGTGLDWRDAFRAFEDWTEHLPAMPAPVDAPPPPTPVSAPRPSAPVPPVSAPRPPVVQWAVPPPAAAPAPTPPRPTPAPAPTPPRPTPSPKPSRPAPAPVPPPKAPRPSDAPAPSVPKARPKPLPWFAVELDLGDWPVDVSVLRAKWRTTAMARHPDRQPGNVEGFKRAKQAYDLASALLGLGLDRWPLEPWRLLSAMTRRRAALALARVPEGDSARIEAERFHKLIADAMTDEAARMARRGMR